MYPSVGREGLLTSSKSACDEFALMSSALRRPGLRKSSSSRNSAAWPWILLSASVLMAPRWDGIRTQLMQDTQGVWGKRQGIVDKGD